MKITQTLVVIAALLASTLCLAQTPASGRSEASPASALAPISYTSEGKLQYPADYRQWIYLSSGLDMSYNSSAQPGHHIFNNVFVNPEAWKSFQNTGSWPDKTILVLEFRHGDSKGSIVKGGQYQVGDALGVEVHIRDDARFKDHWAFFSFDDSKPAEMVPHSEDCYACHSTHGAVDNTFVQFYPTLIELAARHKTLAPGYLEEK
jgi:hypothetical protein